MTPQTITVLLLLIASLAVLLHLMRGPSSLALRGLLIALSLTALFVYTDYGRFQWIKNTPGVASATGEESKRALFHWHEIYHYYLGSKYYRELRNSGLYDAVALADSESPVPVIAVARIRDILDPMHSISIEQARERAQLYYRPNFTPSRWRDFKDDLEYMKSIAAADWLDLALFDAGFNPPPTWNVIGTPLANLLPLSYAWADYPLGWTQAEFLPLLDVALFLISCAFIYRAFALEGLSIFLIIFGTSSIPGFTWISGSFLRYIFVLGIVLGICFLKMHRYFWSGIFLGLATSVIVFPAVFAIGAFLMLLLRCVRERTLENKSRLLGYSAGLALITVILVGASLVQFGVPYWQLFFQRILAHSDTYFVWHIGYRRIAVWDDWVPRQDFWWADGLKRFRLWNEALRARWHSGWFIHYPLIAGLLGLAVFAMRRLRLEEGTLLFGGLALFLLMIPANYYYVYAALIPVALYTKDEGDWRDAALFAGFFLLWGIVYLIPRFETDGLTGNYFVCWAVFVYFLFWLAVRVFYREADSERGV
jgi:hypothetical protein